jgi:hypothetical protein
MPYLRPEEYNAIIKCAQFLRVFVPPQDVYIVAIAIINIMASSGNSYLRRYKLAEDILSKPNIKAEGVTHVTVRYNPLYMPEPHKRVLAADGTITTASDSNEFVVRLPLNCIYNTLSGLDSIDPPFLRFLYYFAEVFAFCLKQEASSKIPIGFTHDFEWICIPTIMLKGVSFQSSFSLLTSKTRGLDQAYFYTYKDLIRQTDDCAMLSHNNSLHTCETHDSQSTQLCKFCFASMYSFTTECIQVNIAALTGKVIYSAVLAPFSLDTLRNMTQKTDSIHKTDFSETRRVLAMGCTCFRPHA